MKHYIIFLMMTLAVSLSSQSKELTVNRNGLLFPNGTELTDPVNAATEIPSGAGVPNVFAEIAGITGSVTNTNCLGCIHIHSFDSYLFRSLDGAGRPFGGINKEFFVLEKKVDPATDELLERFKNSIVTPSIAFKVFAIDQFGDLNLSYTITLSDVRIIEHRFELVFENIGEETHMVDKYYMTYSSITYSDGSSTVVLD